MYKKIFIEHKGISILYGCSFLFFLLINAGAYRYLQSLYEADTRETVDYYFNLINTLLYKHDVNNLNYLRQNIQDLKMLIDQVLPPYLDYKISYNDEIIALSKNYKCKYLYQRQLEFKQGNYLVQLNINKDSYYKLSINYIMIVYFFIWVVSNLILGALCQDKQKIINKLKLKINKKDINKVKSINYKNPDYIFSNNKNYKVKIIWRNN